MFKRISALLLTVVLVVSLAGITMATTPASDTTQQTVPETQSDPAPSAEPAEPAQPTVAAAPAETEQAPAEPNSSKFYLNEEPVSKTGMYFSDGILYCSVRTFFEHALSECTLSVDGSTLTLTGAFSTGEALTVSARPGDRYLTANGRCLYVVGSIQNVKGITMAPVSVMASVFNGSLSWDETSGVARVLLGDRLLTSGDSFYDAQALDLLSHLINSEAGNQPLLGKVAVGNVILNRVASSRFPNSVYDVIYARNQFTVVSTGTFTRSPNASSIVAAKLALEGVSVVPGALYFNRAGISCWASRNRAFVATIGDHSFYG